MATTRYANAPPSPDEVTRAARAALGPGEAGWLVGGCLRDELLGLPVRDVDIVVDGAAEPLARSLADRLGGGVYATSDVFGSWRVVIGDLHIDVAALRGGPPGGPPDPADAAASASRLTCALATSRSTRWPGRSTATSSSIR